MEELYLEHRRVIGLNYAIVVAASQSSLELLLRRTPGVAYTYVRTSTG